MKKRKILFWSFAIICVVIAFIAMCDIVLSRNASGKTYDNVDRIPHREVGSILVTSPIPAWNGRRNIISTIASKLEQTCIKQVRLIGSLSVVEITEILRMGMMSLLRCEIL